jgi:hypothetical protein
VVNLKRRLWSFSPLLKPGRNKDILSKSSLSRSSQLTPKGSKELKRLDSFINYVSKGSMSKSSGRRGWVSSVPF